MENLTKENFFNEMKEKYPKAMDHFCKWIDEYKQRVDWNTIFRDRKLGGGENSGAFNQIQSAWRIPKYHEVPLEFQVGIFFRYLGECHQLPGEPKMNILENVIESLPREFKRIEEKLSKS